MRTGTLFIALTALTLATIAANAVADEVPPPGKVRGYFLSNRWGQNIFVNESRVYFVSLEASKVLAKNIGKPLEVNVTKWLQESNPGAARMETIQGAEALKPSLEVTVVPVKKSVTTGSGVTVRITLTNVSGEDQKVIARNLFVCLATNKPAEPNGFHDPDGRAFWFHQEGMNTEDGVMVRAVHDLRIDMDARKMVAQGKNIRRVSAEGDDNPVVAIAPGGSFSMDVTVGTELPAGEYEIFAYAECGELTPPMSGRVPFDVLEKK